MDENTTESTGAASSRDSTRAPCSAWIACADRLPDDTKWHLIVIDNSERGVPDEVGLGWRTMRSDGSFTGWWQTNHGQMTEQHVAHWMPVPSLPNINVSQPREPRPLS
jgi:hypothetical protein